MSSLRIQCTPPLCSLISAPAPSQAPFLLPASHCHSLPLLTIQGSASEGCLLRTTFPVHPNVPCHYIQMTPFLEQWPLGVLICFSWSELAPGQEYRAAAVCSMWARALHTCGIHHSPPDREPNKTPPLCSLWLQLFILQLEVWWARQTFLTQKSHTLGLALFS